MPGLGHPPGEGALRRKGSLSVGIGEIVDKKCVDVFATGKNPASRNFQKILAGKKSAKIFFLSGTFRKNFPNQKKFQKIFSGRNFPKKL